MGVGDTKNCKYRYKTHQGDTKHIRLLVVCVLLFAALSDAHKSRKPARNSRKPPRNSQISESSTASSYTSKCKAPKCPKLRSPPNGRIAAIVVCDTGYKVNGNNMINCQENGKWSSDLPTCVIDECSSNPCQNEGSCTDLVNGYSCSCVSGYTGVLCETNIDECSIGPCQNEGNCTDLVNGYTCQCVDGYTGIFCETDIDECSIAPCQNEGNCTDLVNGYMCQCVEGYTGTFCETDIDECSTGPCQNEGNCTDLVNGYTCECVEGYTGTFCETDINECTSSPCENGGTCTDLVNGYTCLCDRGFTGTMCETNCTATGLIGLVAEDNSYYTYGPDQWPWVLTGPTSVGLRNFELTLRFKTLSPTGILFFAKNAPSTTDAVRNDFLGAYMENGYMNFATLTSVSRGLSITTTNATYNDGIWHSAEFGKRGDFVDLCVDGSCSTGAAISGSGNLFGQTTISPWFYFGGVSSELSAKAQQGLTLTAGFTGCIANITVKGQDGGLPAATYNTTCCT